MSKKLVLHSKDFKGQDHSAVIARQGHSKDRIVQSSYRSLVPSRSTFTNTELSRPSEDEVNEATMKAQEALNKIVSTKISKTQPKSVAATVTSRGGATYIRYKSSSLFNNGEPMERIIKIVDKQQDPMLPPKFAVRKAPQRPPSPPPPILHEPSAKLTAQDHKDWYIPPAISNWKNDKGFTIAIDKRMAYLNNDNKPVEINDNFGNLSEALEKAEQDAREEIKIKNEMRLKLQERENQERELKLKELAEKAKLGRRSYNDDDGYRNKSYSTDYQDARQREQSRMERRRKAEREIKLSKLTTEQRLRNDNVSERVIKNLTQNKSNAASEPEFDSRLHQVGGDNNNNVYDNDMIAYQQQAVFFDNNNNGDDDERGVRTEPVQFERDELVAEQNKSFGLQDNLEQEEGPSAKKSKLT